uniref:Sushi, nidogen and EGF-like domain-containing protein 1 n=1 Tax=Angiostrongylus cantonensis TaxID=6313 RepID=A0A0K0DJ67_ANGCA
MLEDLCASAPCTHGLCVDTLFDRRCVCNEGWTGENCDVNIDDCASQPCQNGGTCTDQFCEDDINTFNCLCKPGYSGRLCEIRISQCAFSPCMNNGTCHDEGASYKCECASGWTGATCEQETGTCDTRPCRNDGQCVNLVADYFCVCPEGCQYLRDACTESICQNDGECNRTSDGGFHCSCKPGFTGIYCETNINDCARSPCPLGATCIDQINSAYCRCPFNMTGANCDKAIDEDYDLHFFDPLRPSSASLALPFIINTKAIAVALWVKFDQSQSHGTVLTMYHSKKANYSADMTEVLRIGSERVTIALFSNENPLQLHYPMNQKINDGLWNHLVFTWSSELGTYSLIWNSVRIFSGDGYGVGREFKINALISLGSLEAEEEFFAGLITRVYIWSRVLDFNSEIPMMVASCRETQLVYDNLLLRFAGYTEMKGKVERIPNSTCGRAKRKRLESTVKATSCPSDQYVITSQREVNVTWPEPEFQSKNPLEKVLTNFKQGQVFTWGEYDVLYVGFDNISNTAECSFKIHVSREHCPSPEDPVNGVQACESWGPHLRYKACSVECNDGYEFSRPPAIFYTCAADGIWRPRQRNQLVFRYPQCTKSVPATRVVLLRVSYPGSSPCSEASREALRNRLLANIQTINQKWDICTLTDQAGCVGIRIEVDCSDEFVRLKRESYSFNVRVELPVKR